MVAARLQRIAELGDVLLVLAQARLDRSGFALEPVAAVARMPSGVRPGCPISILKAGTNSECGDAGAIGSQAKKVPRRSWLSSAASAMMARHLLAECGEMLLAFGRAPATEGEARSQNWRSEQMGLLPLADALLARVAPPQPFSVPFIFRIASAPCAGLPWLSWFLRLAGLAHGPRVTTLHGLAAVVEESHAGEDTRGVPPLAGDFSALRSFSKIILPIAVTNRGSSAPCCRLQVRLPLRATSPRFGHHPR